MIRILKDIGLMLGGAPVKPADADVTPAARDLNAFKQTPAEKARRKAAIKDEREHEVENHRWRWRRWASIIVVNLIFVVSFRLDVQLVEGALTASRVLGFHFADLNSSLQVMLAHRAFLVNLVIGVVTVAALYAVVGGRSFCSWVCPYHLVAELAEMLHLKLVARKLVRDHPMHRGLRAVLFVIFAALALVTGYTVFETISPVGILSRALTYGATLALLWVALLVLVEVFYSRRFWCRYACPIGLAYGAIGAVAPVRIVHDAENCLHEGKCRTVCMVPHVLDMTKLGHSAEVVTPIGADCTRCAMCLDACPTGALRFDIKGLSRPAKGKSHDQLS